MDKIYNRFTGEVMCDGKSLQEVLRLHEMWLKRTAGGADANLADANLAGAYLTGVNLAGANLARANLACAYLGKWGKILSFVQTGGIGSVRRATIAFHTDKGVFVQCGCWGGWLEQFEERVAGVHGDSVYGKEYEAAIAYFKAVFKARGAKI